MKESKHTTQVLDTVRPIAHSLHGKKIRVQKKFSHI